MEPKNFFKNRQEVTILLVDLWVQLSWR